MPDVKLKFPEGTEIADNRSTPIIVTTTDKARVHLMRSKAVLSSRISWTGPLGIFLTSLVVVLNGQFEKNFLGLEPKIWESIFVLVTLGSLIWTFVEIFKAVYRKIKYGDGVEFMVNKLRSDPIDNRDS